MRGLLLYFLGAMSLVGFEPAYSHHSRSVYDLTTEITINGTVARYEWINPHVYIYVEAEGDAGQLGVWEIEASPPSLMRRRGWTRETLKEGDEISVRANPAKERSHTMALGVALETQAGVTLDMLETTSFADAGPPIPARATNLEGTWLTILNRAVAAPFIFGPTSWSLTPNGKLALEQFEEEMNPGRDCVAYTAPFSMVFPDTKRIQIDGSNVLIRSEFEDVLRVVHMNDALNADAPATLHGYSIGRWSGDTLIVETEHFANHRFGNAFKLPSGPQKHLIERFELSADRTALTYSFELSDADYLTDAITGEIQWAYRPDLELNPVACSLENARRYLE